MYHLVFLASPEHVLMTWINLNSSRLSAYTFFAEDRLLRKKVLECSDPSGPSPAWGQEVTVKMQCVLEDRTVVEKDSKLVFVIGEGDVNQVNTNCCAQYAMINANNSIRTSKQWRRHVEQVNCPLCVSSQFSWC